MDSPKLLTIPDAKYLLRPAHTPWLPISVGAPALPHRMLAICDISADPGGSIEYVYKLFIVNAFLLLKIPLCNNTNVIIYIPLSDIFHFKNEEIYKK